MGRRGFVSRINNNFPVFFIAVPQTQQTRFQPLMHDSNNPFSVLIKEYLLAVS
jgi:hypothetical protein